MYWIDVMLVWAQKSASAYHFIQLYHHIGPTITCIWCSYSYAYKNRSFIMDFYFLRLTTSKQRERERENSAAVAYLWRLSKQVCSTSYHHRVTNEPNHQTKTSQPRNRCLYWSTAGKPVKQRTQRWQGALSRWLIVKVIVLLALAGYRLRTRGTFPRFFQHKQKFT